MSVQETTQPVIPHGLSPLWSLWPFLRPYRGRIALALALLCIGSATILLVRDGAKGLEVFMVQRHHRIDFATGAMVFPGGKVDDAGAKGREGAQQV